MIFTFDKNLNDKVKSIIEKDILIGQYYFLHGTFASNKVKLVTDVDLTNYYEVDNSNLSNNKNIFKDIKIHLEKNKKK